MPSSIKVKTGPTAQKRQYQYLNPTDDVSQIVNDFHQYSWWFFGLPKIGKTAVAAKFDGARFCATEFGHKSQKVKKDDLVGLPWPAYLEYVDVLEKAYDVSFAYMKEELGIEGDPQWSEWVECRAPFLQWCKDLMTIPSKGCVFISHVSSRDLEDAAGMTHSQVHPNFSGKVLTAIEGEVDIIAYFTYVKDHRVIQIEGDDNVRAGNRLTENFLCEGRPLKYIPMGRDASEAYNNILRAFENDQKPSDLYHIFPPKEPSLPKKLAPEVAKKFLKK